MFYNNYSIQAKYGPRWAPQRGSPYGFKSQIIFNYNEYITKAVVGVGRNGVLGNITTICSLKFYTNLRVYGPFGDYCVNATTVSFGKGLAYMAGRSGTALDAIMFYNYGITILNKYTKYDLDLYYIILKQLISTSLLIFSPIGLHIFDLLAQLYLSRIIFLYFTIQGECS